MRSILDIYLTLTNDHLNRERDKIGNYLLSMVKKCNSSMGFLTNSDLSELE